MDELKKELAGSVKKLYGVEDAEIEFASVPEGMKGDLATNIAMRLAKSLKRNPREIANEIVGDLSGEMADVCSFEVAGAGFINITIADERLIKAIQEVAQNFDKWKSDDLFKGKVVLCEFSDPNPFKVLHVGHLYTSIVGDAISRLYESEGATVKRLNYGGDVGMHVAKTLYAVIHLDFQDLYKELKGISKQWTPAETAEQIGKAYVAGTNAFEEDEEAQSVVRQMNKELYQIAEEKLKDSELAQLYWAGRKLSYEYFEDFYASIGLKFDKYYPESAVAARGLEKVKEQIKTGVYEESDGAVIFRGEKYGLHTRVFVNREGVPTYEAKDIGLVLTKWHDYHFDKSIIITGNEQNEYFKVMLKSLEQFEPELVKRTDHLSHGMVRLAGDVKMSSRKGNFLKAVDTIAAIRNNMGGDKADEKVVMGATKYAFLKYKLGGNIVFSAEESVSTTGNSGVYLQYAVVRAQKIIKQIQQRKIASKGKAWRLSDKERRLIQKLLDFKTVKTEAVQEQSPYKICAYLYETAQDFNRFYEENKVIGSELECERGEIVGLYAKIMAYGLALIGIEVPEEM